MYLAVLVTTLVVATTQVLGSSVLQDRSWMLIPGQGGSHLAVLNSAMPTIKIKPTEDITFFFYSRSNPDKPVQIFVDNLNDAAYGSKKPTKLITHGFASSGHASWLLDMKNEFLRGEDCNVIIVNWENLATAPLYNLASANAKHAGKYTASLLDYLLTNANSSVINMHLIGHNLGAHVMGLAGRAMMSGGKVARITALDPALPLHKFENVDNRLHEDDANFVDVIHTCSGWLGFDVSIGHADFYPNGGVHSQPGCNSDFSGACSHDRAHQLFTESITSSQFLATPCATWNKYVNNECTNATSRVSMGNKVLPTTRGTFFLSTSSASPFALA